MYYFKPNSLQFGAYAVQILSWGTGYAMAKYLPTRQFNIFRWTFSLNPGPFNQKEHALLVVAYWGSCVSSYLYDLQLRLLPTNRYNITGYRIWSWSTVSCHKKP